MSQDNNGKFGGWLRSARRRKGWSGEMLAAEIGTSQGNISLYERGLRFPHRERAVALAEALGADPREALRALMADTPGIAPLATLEEVQSSDTILREFDLLTPEEQSVIAGMVTSLLKARNARS